MDSEVWDVQYSSKEMFMVWGNLQYITLEGVYFKAPLRELLHPSGLYKDWKALACQLYRTNPIHKPFFLIACPPIPYAPPHITRFSTLTLHKPSGQWTWNHENLFHIDQLFSVEGLVLIATDLEEVHLQVYDTHAKSIRLVPGVRNMAGRPDHFLGMAVETSVIPYTFKIILGVSDRNTQIYDSTTNSWETRASVMPSVPHTMTSSKSCLHCEGYVYTWSYGTESILVYGLREDAWSLLEPPPRNRGYGMEVALGAWEGRVFAVTEDGGMLALSVWELVDRVRQVWKLFQEVSVELRAWLTPTRFGNEDSVRVFASFCDEEVCVHRLLVKPWVGGGGSFVSERNVLLNLASREWKRMVVSKLSDYDAESP